MKPELHLIVLANARHKEREILKDIQEHVTIKNVYDIQWTKEKVADNFSRFYGQKLPDKSFKEQECGAGPFLCIVVEDGNPTYDFVETSRGHELANMTLFALKEKYRSWTNGGHKIHTTNSIQKTNHDASLMLGLNYRDLEKSLPPKWDGKIKKINRDLTGCHGWKDFKEFFYTLNATTDYVVLRGAEDIQKTIDSEEHGDIDIMVRDYNNTVFIVGGEKHFPQARPHYLTKIGNKEVYIDLWDIKNHYHDKKWDENILQSRAINDDGISVPSLENYFYMMIYHCLIHKQTVADDYYAKIYDLFVKLGLNKKYDIAQYDSPFDLYFQLLETFMKTHHYDFTQPSDNNVFFSEKLTRIDELRKFFQEKYAICDIRTIHTDKISDSYNLFLSGVDKNGTNLFIKMSDISGLYKNEYVQTKKAYDIDPVHFVKPIYYRDDEGNNFVATERIKGTSLDDLIKNGKLVGKIKKQAIEDLYQIYQALKKSDVVHRDINPQNLIYTDNGHFMLIDFQLAVSKKTYKELDYLKKNLLLLAGLGREFAYGRFQWDDSYSLLKVLELIGCEAEYKDFYVSIYQEIEENIGKDSVLFFSSKKKIRFKLLQYKIKSKLSLSSEKRKKYRQKRKELKMVYKLLRNRS